MIRFLAPLLAFGLLLAGCGDNSADTRPRAERTPQTAAAQPPARTQPPGQVAFTLRDTDGNIRTADEWLGRKPVVINFWGTWCGPCRREIPDMVKIYREYSDRIEILGIALNDTPDKVKRFSAQQGMTWQMLIGDQTVAVDFGIRGIPTTFFFDAKGNLFQVEDYNGTIVNHYVGPRDYKTFKRAIESIINSSPAGS